MCGCAILQGVVQTENKMIPKKHFPITVSFDLRADSKGCGFGGVITVVEMKD
jgi:hypothetical protein